MTLDFCKFKRTAADYYTTDNNPNRSETPAQAIKIDNKLIEAWQNHPKHSIFHNISHFSTKSREVVNYLSNLLAIELPLINAGAKKINKPQFTPTKRYSVTISKLSDGPVATTLIKRVYNNNTMYTLHSLLSFQQKPVEKERSLSSREYAELLSSSNCKTTELIVYPFNTSNEAIEYLHDLHTNYWYLKSSSIPVSYVDEYLRTLSIF